MFYIRIFKFLNLNVQICRSRYQAFQVFLDVIVVGKFLNLNV